MINVEVCINTDSQQTVIESVSAAYEGGASRIELCGAMHFDGLTPKIQSIVEARKSFKDRVGLLTMIRPRSGNFYYSKEELQEMCGRIKHAAEAGADGAVFGVLNQSDNSISIEATKKLIESSKKYNLSTTFHRAFDATPDPLKSLELLIELGVDRILTSGTPWGEKGSAVEGIDMLKQIIKMAETKIEIVIGGGVNSRNVGEILQNLPFAGNKVSVHSYSGVQENGITSKKAVELLIKKANKVDIQ